MRVLVVSYHPLNDNRIYKYLSTIRMISDQIEYINISIDSGIKPNIPNKVRLIRYNNKINKWNLFGYIFLLHIIKKRIEKSNIDIIHIHDPLLMPLVKVAKKKNIATVYDKHEAYEVCGGIVEYLSKIFDKMYSKNIDGIVYVARAQEKYINEYNYPYRVQIPNYQSLRIYKQPSLTRTECDDVTLIYFGLISQTSRDITKMLNIMEKLLIIEKKITIKIGGEIDDQIIQKRITTLKNRYQNFIYYGYLPYADVVGHTLHADIGLYFQNFTANNVGSSPNKIYEYLISGLAIVSVGRYENWESIDNFAGRAFGYEIDEEEIISYIMSLIRNKSDLDRLKKNSYLLGKKFSWEGVENRYIDLYRKVINHSY